jgi:hypothetical protein
MWPAKGTLGNQFSLVPCVYVYMTRITLPYGLAGVPLAVHFGLSRLPAKVSHCAFG